MIKSFENFVNEQIVADDGYAYCGLEDYYCEQEDFRKNWTIDYIDDKLGEDKFCKVPILQSADRNYPGNIINYIGDLNTEIASFADGDESDDKRDTGRMYDILLGYTYGLRSEFEKYFKENIEKIDKKIKHLERMCKKYPMCEDDKLELEKYN